MSNPGDFAQMVKQQADIVRVIGDYVKLKKSGTQNFSGLCPFHDEKSPSFSVHATRQFYHCFGCGASGDVFSFIQNVEKVSFPEAVREVAQKAGIPLPRQQFSGPGEARDARLRNAILEMHEHACKFFEGHLKNPEGAKAREYLANRGVGDDLIREFRIGYAPDSGFQLRDLLKASYDHELMKASGLFSWKAEAEEKGLAEKNAGQSPLYSRFRNRIMFPISSDAGRIIAFGGRSLETGDKAGPKYLNSPETPIYSKGRVLYNLDKAKDAIRKLDYAILVEGYFDCITVFAAGFQNVIASSGTAFTEPQVKLLGRFTKKIVVNFDPDTAGAKAAERSLAMLVGEEFTVKVVTLQRGLDPDLYIRDRGQAAYGKELMGAQKYFDYLIERARAQFSVKSAEGKVQALNFLLPYIQRIPSRIARDELAADLGQKLAIDSAVLRQELKHAVSTRAATVKAAPEVQVTSAEKILVRALVSQKSGSGPEDFDPRRQMHYKLTNEPLHVGLPTESLITALLPVGDELPDELFDPMALPLTEPDRRLLAAILMDENEELTAELLHQALDALRRQHLQKKQRDLKFRIAEAERKRDASALDQLVREKVEVDRALAGS